MKKRLMLLFSFMLIACVAAFAQLKSVRGVVVSSEDGEPVVGATVTVKGYNTWAVTNINGEFTIAKLPKESGITLIFSSLGMVSQELAATAEMKVVLKPQATEIDELIVVAFGKQKKESFTGSAGTVSSEQISERQVSSPLAAINGRVAGVQMVEGNGPDPSISIIVRGISSVNAGTSPLIVLDGLPYSGYYSDINPNDVESISVLKDAASTALYGARGANGVVLITTKQASRGGAVVTFDAKIGVSDNARVDYDCIDNPGQYYETHYKALYNYNRSIGQDDYTAFLNANKALVSSSDNGGLGFISYSVPDGEYLIGSNGRFNPNATPGVVVTGVDGNKYTIQPDNWKKEALRKGIRHEYNVSVNGGNETFQTYASLGYMKNKGLVKGLDYERYTGRIKTDYQARKWLKIGANVSYTHNESNNMYNAFSAIYKTPSIYPVYVRDENGNILKNSHGAVYDYGDGAITGLYRPVYINDNPLQSDRLDFNKNNSNSFGGQIYSDVTFLKDFKFTANVSIYDTENRTSSGANPYYGYNSTTGGSLSTTNYRTYAMDAHQLLNWSHQFGRHNASVLLGHEYSKNKNNHTGAQKLGFFDYQTHRELNTMLKNSRIDGSADEYNVEGYFMRAQYDYAEKYFASVSFRRDGSSRFHPDNRWGNFWSVGGAWILSKDFKMPSWIDLLKIKASYGKQGNDSIYAYNSDDYTYDYYLYEDYYAITTVNGESALRFRRKGNKDITWETNANFNAGLEFELFNRRLRGGVEYYIRKTTDMLMEFTVPQSMGYDYYYDNVGDMKNQGVELSLEGDVIRSKNVTWSVNVNVTGNKNKVTSLPAAKKTDNVDGHWGFVSSAGSWHYVGEGLPINTWYLKRYAGVNDNGEAMWCVKDGSKTTATANYGEASYYTCGDPNPKVYGGFGTSLKVYGLDFNANFSYSIGGKAFDYGYQTLMASPTSGVTGYSIHTDVANAWSKNNKNSNIPRWQYNDVFSNGASDRFLTDASYLTLQNVTLGYTLPNKWLKALNLVNLRVFVSADNVAYWSKRKGFDPRTSLYGETYAGDISPMRTISGGIQIKF